MKALSVIYEAQSNYCSLFEKSPKVLHGSFNSTNVKLRKLRYTVQWLSFPQNIKIILVCADTK